MDQPRPTNPSDRQLWEAFSSELPVDSVSCPDPMVVAAWADGTLEAEDHERLETHLAGCAACRQAVALLRLESGEGDVPVTPAVLAAARALAAEVSIFCSARSVSIAAMICSR